MSNNIDIQRTSGDILFGAVLQDNMINKIKNMLETAGFKNIIAYKNKAWACPGGENATQISFSLDNRTFKKDTDKLSVISKIAEIAEIQKWFFSGETVEGNLND